MLKKHLTKLLTALTIAALGTGTLLQADGQNPQKAETAQPAVAAESKAIRDPVAQLRGKLLYKRSQTRKLERIAVSKDPDLGEKILRLEAEIEALYCAAEPKLTSLYAEQKQLNSQIESLSKKE